jgi:hypothetical protein
MNNFPQHISSDYNEKHIGEPLNTRFIRLQIYKSSYVVRCFRPVTTTLIKQFPCLFSLHDEIWNIFGGNSSTSKQTLTLGTENNRQNLTDAKPRNSCRNLLKRSLMHFIVNQEKFQACSAAHIIANLSSSLNLKSAYQHTYINTTNTHSFHYDNVFITFKNDSCLNYYTLHNGF